MLHKQLIAGSTFREVNAVHLSKKNLQSDRSFRSKLPLSFINKSLIFFLPVAKFFSNNLLMYMKVLESPDRQGGSQSTPRGHQGQKSDFENASKFK